DALASTSLEPVFLEGRALAEAALGDGEDADALLHHLRRDDLVALVHVDAAHAPRRAPHRAHFLLGEADDHARLRGEQDLTLAVGRAATPSSPSSRLMARIPPLRGWENWLSSVFFTVPCLVAKRT